MALHEEAQLQDHEEAAEGLAGHLAAERAAKQASDERDAALAGLRASLLAASTALRSFGGGAPLVQRSLDEGPLLGAAPTQGPEGSSDECPLLGASLASRSLGTETPQAKREDLVEAEDAEWRFGHKVLVDTLRLEVLQLRLRLKSREDLQATLAGDAEASRRAAAAMLELGDRQTMSLSSLRDENEWLSQELRRVEREATAAQERYWDGVPFSNFSTGRDEVDALRSGAEDLDAELRGMERELRSAQRGAKVAATEASMARACLRDLLGNPGTPTLSFSIDDDSGWLSFTPRRRPGEAEPCSASPELCSELPSLSPSSPGLCSDEASASRHGSPLRGATAALRSGALRSLHAAGEAHHLAEAEGQNLALRQEIALERQRSPASSASFRYGLSATPTSPIAALSASASATASPACVLDCAFEDESPTPSPSGWGSCGGSRGEVYFARAALAEGDTQMREQLLEHSRLRAEIESQLRLRAEMLEQQSLRAKIEEQERQLLDLGLERQEQAELRAAIEEHVLRQEQASQRKLGTPYGDGPFTEAATIASTASSTLEGDPVELERYEQQRLRAEILARLGGGLPPAPAPLFGSPPWQAGRCSDGLSPAATEDSVCLSRELAEQAALRRQIFAARGCYALGRLPPAPRGRAQDAAPAQDEFEGSRPQARPEVQPHVLLEQERAEQERLRSEIAARVGARAYVQAAGPPREMAMEPVVNSAAIVGC